MTCRLWSMVLAGVVATWLVGSPWLASATLRFGGLQIRERAVAEPRPHTEREHLGVHPEPQHGAPPSRLRLARGRQVHHQVRHPVHREVLADAGVARRLRQHLQRDPGRPAEDGHPRQSYPGAQLTPPEEATRWAQLSPLRHEGRQPGGRPFRRLTVDNLNLNGLGPEPRHPAVSRTSCASCGPTSSSAAFRSHPRRPPADRLGRDRQLPDARPRQLAQPDLALPAGDPRPGVRLGRDPPPVLDDQVRLRPRQRLEALAELPRVVLEPGRLGTREADLPAATLGPALRQFAHQRRGRRVLRRPCANSTFKSDRRPATTGRPTAFA